MKLVSKKIAILLPLVFWACLSTPTIKRSGFASFARGQPLAKTELENLRQQFPKDLVFTDLLQAFALMRTEDLNQASVRKNILNLLSMSVSSFEDMDDPVNFSKAFTADESKPYRGRSYERMFASLMTAVFLIADKKYDQALPYLRNAEFLDVRFQKMPFGTDVSLIYALMYYCLLKTSKDKKDLARAYEGLAKSIRFLSLKDQLEKALKLSMEYDLRPMAVSNRLGYMIFEISLYYSLMTSDKELSIDALIDDAKKNSSLFIATIKAQFNDEYKERNKPMIKELARVYGMNSKRAIDELENLTIDEVYLQAQMVGDKITTIIKKTPSLLLALTKAHTSSKVILDKIIRQINADKLILTFLERGPTVVRTGSYNEVTEIKPSKTASVDFNIRQKKLKLNTSCGFHRLADGGFSLVLCDKNNLPGKIEDTKNLELMSLSRKATSMQGREFDKILRGRARFRAASEKVSEISLWSAFFLFHMGSEIFSNCQRSDASESCYTKAYVMWAIGGVTAAFSGVAWLIGRTKNPSADSRFVHLMYESVWFLVED